MTQRIFDTDNEEDMKLLWSILPDWAEKARKVKTGIEFLDKDNEPCLYIHDGDSGASIIKINWHDKTEITRPIQEVTEQDIGKLCYFWDNNTSNGTYCILVEVESGMYKSKRKGYYEHCRRLTKQEIEELC